MENGDMNIFYLHKDPKICAEMHCDKHVVKMIIEYAQLLSTAHRVLDGDMYFGKSKTGRKATRYRHPDKEMDDNLYLASHLKHPSQLWIHKSRKNYIWMYELWINLCQEYTYRYEKKHVTQVKLENYLDKIPKNIPDAEWTEPTPAMSHYPQCIVPNDSLQSYHNYYIADKIRFAKWKKREIPEWFQKAVAKMNLVEDNNANIYI